MGRGERGLTVTPLTPVLGQYPKRNDGQLFSARPDFTLEFETDSQARTQGLQLAATQTVSRTPTRLTELVGDQRLHSPTQGHRKKSLSIR